MSFYEQRLKQITDMFVETLEHMEQSPQLAQLRTPDLAKYRIEYIGEIIRESMSSEKEKYIQNLYQQLERVKGGAGDQAYLQQLAQQYETELTTLRRHYEELLAKAERVRETIDSEVKKHIEQRINQIERDYILKVVHEQEMKLLEVRLTGRNHSEEINFLKGTIMELQEQIEVLTAELNNYKNALSETRRSRTRHQGSGEAEANQFGNGLVDRNQLLAIEFYGKQNASFDQEYGCGKNGRLEPFQGRDGGRAELRQVKSSFQSQLEVLRKSLRNKHVEMIRGGDRDEDEAKPALMSSVTAPGVYGVDANQFRKLQTGEFGCRMLAADSTSAKSLVRSPRYEGASSRRGLGGWRKEHEDKPVKGVGRPIPTYNFKYLNIKI